MRQTSHTLGVVLLVIVAVGSVGAGPGAAATVPDSVGQSTDGQDASTQDSNATVKGPFAFTVERVVPCGLTCRNVTVGLENRGNQTLRNVTVESNVTVGDEVLVRRTAQIDQLAPNESVNRSVRVEVGFAEVQQIRANDGTVTIRTRVTSERYDETFALERSVI